MNHHYRDIRDRIPEPPKWFDERCAALERGWNVTTMADALKTKVILAVSFECPKCHRRIARTSSEVPRRFADHVARRT